MAGPKEALDLWGIYFSMGAVVIVEFIIIGSGALLTIGFVVRDILARPSEPDYTEPADRSASGWGGAGAAD